MKDTFRRCGISLVFFAIVFLAGAANDPALQDTSSQGTPSQGAPPQGVTSQDKQADSAEPVYSIAAKFAPGDVSYFIIENEYRDSGAILSQAFPLSYATTLRERRTIIQRVLEPTTQPGGDSKSSLVRVSWECDRYEVRERPPMSTEDSWYDSHRHTFPPPSLRSFGEIPGATMTFLVDPETGETSKLAIKPAKLEGRSTRKKLSSTGEKCRLNAENIGKLLADLGPFYLPESPKRVGEKWALTHKEKTKGDLTLITKLTCTLRSVREKDGHKIATIDLDGAVSLEAKPTTQPQAKQPLATSRPAKAPNASGKRQKPPGKRSGKGAAQSDKARSPATSRPTTNESAANRSTAKPLSSVLPGPSLSPSHNSGSGSEQALFSMRTVLSAQAEPPQKSPTKARGPASRPTSTRQKGARRSTGARGNKQAAKGQPKKRTRTTTKPNRTPTKPRKARKKNKPEFSLKSASCQGTVEFDLTRGELVEMHLHRESNLSAKLKSKAKGVGPTTIEQGATQTLRVVVRHTPPRKPVIVGGKTPPVIPERDKPKPPKQAKSAKKTTSPQATTRPRKGPGKKSHRPTTTRPSTAGRGQPFMRLFALAPPGNAVN